MKPVRLKTSPHGSSGYLNLNAPYRMAWGLYSDQIEFASDHDQAICIYIPMVHFDGMNSNVWVHVKMRVMESSK